jgi:acetylornithine deacetylase/succinyl-diaminopimelate desuccinylase-like protein
VLIPHFYDDVEPLTATEKRALSEVPDVDAQLIREFGAGSRIGKPMTLAELVTLPVLSLRGLLSASVGPNAAGIVPASATASMSFGPVKGMDYHKTFERIRQHIRAQGYFISDAEPSLQTRMAHEKVALVTPRSGSYNGTRTSMDLPIAREVIRAAEAVGGPVIKLPTMGGAIPLEMIERVTGAPTIIVPIANHDDNQHGLQPTAAPWRRPLRLKRRVDMTSVCQSRTRVATWDVCGCGIGDVRATEQGRHQY